MSLQKKAWDELQGEFSFRGRVGLPVSLKSPDVPYLYGLGSAIENSLHPQHRLPRNTAMTRGPMTMPACRCTATLYSLPN